VKFNPIFIVMLCYVMVPLLPPINCVEDSWGWRLYAASAQLAARLTSEYIINNNNNNIIINNFKKGGLEDLARLSRNLRALR
jgi:hypothetical protein